MMSWRRRSSIEAKLNSKIGKRLLHQVVVFIYCCLVGDAFFLRSDGDRYTMFIAAANEKHLLSLCFQVSRVYIGRQVTASQMAYMYRAVGVRQGSGNGMAFSSH